MKFIFAGLIHVEAAYSIYCKVSGTHEMLNEGRPFVLVIPGGPGFGLLSLEQMIMDIDQQAQSNELSEVHYILYDPLGCGKTEPGKDPVNEYNPYYYAEIGAQVIEALQKKLGLIQIDLRVLGRSAGGMVALLLPMIRPSWRLNPEKNGIFLSQIISVVGLVSYRAMEEALSCIHESYGKEYIPPFQKLLEGNIIDLNDYFNNIAMPLAPLYAEENVALVNGYLGKILRFNSSLTIFLLGILKNYSNTYLYINDSLTGCALNVINTFFRQKFLNVDIEKIVSENLDLYQDIPIFAISAQKDYIVIPHLNAGKLESLLPENMSHIILNTKHSISSEAPQLFSALINKILRGSLNKKFLKINFEENTYAKINQYRLAEFYKTQKIFFFKKNVNHPLQINPQTLPKELI